MKFFNMMILASFMVFNLAQAADNENDAGQKYNECMQNAANELRSSAQDHSLTGKPYWTNYQNAGANSSYINHYDKFIQSRYNHRCNQCLMQYVITRAFSLLKRR